MRCSKVRVWDQGNDFYKKFQDALAKTEDNTCPCVTKSFTDVIGSDRVDMSGDLQVILPHVLPFTDLDSLFVKPTMKANLRAANGPPSRAARCAIRRPAPELAIRRRALASAMAAADMVGGVAMHDAVTTRAVAEPVTRGACVGSLGSGFP